MSLIKVTYLLCTIRVCCASSDTSLDWEAEVQLNTPSNYLVQGAVLGYLNSTASYYYMAGLPANGVTLRAIYSWNTEDKFWKLSSITFPYGFMVDDQQYIIYNDTFYIFNPFNVFRFSGELWLFDGINPVIRYYSNQTEMQYPISFGCSVTNGSHVFVIGGQSATGQYVQHVQLFHLEAMKYVSASLEPIPVQIAHPTCQYYSLTNSIYVFGGYTYSNNDCNGAVDSIWRFDITDNEWISLNATMSSPRAYFSSVMRRINDTDYIYLIGGRTTPCKTLDTVDIFELDTEECNISTTSRLINPVESASVFADENGILVVGGNNYTGVKGVYDLYNEAYIASYDETGVEDDLSVLGLTLMDFVIIIVCLVACGVSCLLYIIWRRKRKHDDISEVIEVEGLANYVRLGEDVKQGEGITNAQTAFI